MWSSEAIASPLVDAWRSFAAYEQARLRAWLDAPTLPAALRAAIGAALAAPADDVAAWALALEDVDLQCTDWFFRSLL